jgi:hypothetical protein
MNESNDTSALVRARGRDVLLRDYRNWLESELKLLGNSSHHAYAFGQANMAKRALDGLDAELAKTLYVAIDRGAARRVLTAIEALAQHTTAEPPELAELRDAITAALADAARPIAEDAEPIDTGNSN